MISNRLAEPPSSLEYLFKTLVRVDLTKNQIVDCRVLCESYFYALKDIDLAQNELSQFYLNVSELVTQLPNLRNLDLSGNQLSSIPDLRGDEQEQWDQGIILI